MKRQKIFLSMVAILFMLCNIHLQNAKAENIDQQALYNSYITLLNPYVKKATDKQYDLFDAKIIYVKPINEGTYDFIVKVKYNTYTGPHNTPEGTQTFVFRINPDGADLVDQDYKPLRDTK